jgi:TonB family protein
LSGKELAAKVLGQLRAPGGVPLDPPRPLSDPSRRRSISSPERDVVLRMYVEGWRSKIERNGPLNYRPLASRQARDYPVVTVSIRSDGSLEDVLIHRSSGLRELDEAVRRIARLYAPYSAFPPEVARQYDVIEIRRVWQFGDTLSIVEETR